MKVWFIYYLGDLDKVSLPCDGDEHDERLYAITNNKKLLNQFTSIRDLDKFKIKKKDMLPSEYSAIANEYRGSVIEIYDLSTKNYDGISKISVRLALTKNEYQVATDEDVIEYSLFSDENWKDYVSPSIFNRKIQKALYTLQYIQCWKLTTQNKLEDYDDYEAPDLSIDEFHAFVSNFSHILKYVKS